MSNSNNPFLPYLTKENNNDDQNNNGAKDNNNISDILEEGSTSALPPPAYDEVVKPQPAQPGSEYPAYPPPPFPPPEMPVRENYNQSHRPPNVHNNNNNSNFNNFNEKWGRNGCCCFGNSRRNRTCGCGWLIVLVIFVILGLISLINNKVCNDLTFGGTPQNFSFDPSTNSILQINTDARIKSGSGGVRVIPSPGNGSQIVNIQVYIGSSGLTPVLDQSSQNGIFQLKISQPGFSIFNVPPRCMISRIDVNLPQQFSFPNTIQTGDLDLLMEQNNTIPYQQNITLSTTNGNIRLTNVSAQTMELDTNNGDIAGSITSISDGLNIQTGSGDTRLHLGSAQTPFNSKTSVNTVNGDVLLTFNGTFSGNYVMQTQDGRIRINGKKQNNNQASGQIIGNNGNGTLNIITNNGDINVTF